MKKAALSLFCILLLLHSCKKEEKAPPATACTISSGYFDDDLVFYKMRYSSNGQIERGTSFFDEVYDYRYTEPGKIHVISDGDTVYIYHLDSNSRISMREEPKYPTWNRTFGYDANGFIINEDFHDEYFEYSIENGDRVKTLVKSSPGGFTYRTITYEYYPQADPKFGAPGNPHWGKVSTHLLKKSVSISSSDTTTRTYEYATNQLGYITATTEIMKSSSGTYSESYETQVWLCK